MGVKLGVKHFVQDVCYADGNAIGFAELKVDCVELKVGQVLSMSAAN